MIHCKRIYNFLCSMLVLCPMPHVFYAFTFIFWLISYTNLSTRCPKPVAIFCYFFYFRKGLKEIFSERAEISRKAFFYPERRSTPKETRRGAKGHQTTPRRGLVCVRAWHPLVALGHPFGSPSVFFFVPGKN